MTNTFESINIAGIDIKLAHDPVFSPLVYNQASLLLAETFALDTPNAHVAVLASAADSFTLWLARTLAKEGGQVIVVEDNAAASAYLRRNLALNSIGNVTFQTTSTAAGAWDIACMNILYQSNSQVVANWLRLGYAHLQPGAPLYLAGAKNRGIMGAGKKLEEIFGTARTVVYRQGYRIFEALRPVTDEAPAPMPAPQESQTETAEVRGLTLHIQAREGVFAQGRLDAATELLIDHMQINPTDDILDLGCGSGIIGIRAAQLAPEGRTVLVDTDTQAVELANANIAANKVGNAIALASDTIDAVRDTLFDVVLTNPPFHMGRVQTHAIANRFITDAPTVMRDGGRFYVVANAFLKYEPQLRGTFNNVTEVANDGQYKVLLAIKEGKRQRRKRLVAEAAQTAEQEDSEWEALKASIERP